RVLPSTWSTPFPYTTLFRSPAAEGCSGVTRGPEPCGRFRPENALERAAWEHPRPGCWAVRLQRETGEQYDEVRQGREEQRARPRSEEHTSELQSRENLVCRL